jgi:hypothetical protein
MELGALLIAAPAREIDRLDDVKWRRQGVLSDIVEPDRQQDSAPACKAGFAQDPRAFDRRA